MILYDTVISVPCTVRKRFKNSSLPYLITLIFIHSLDMKWQTKWQRLIGNKSLNSANLAILYDEMFSLTEKKSKQHSL